MQPTDFGEWSSKEMEALRKERDQLLLRLQQLEQDGQARWKYCGKSAERVPLKLPSLFFVLGVVVVVA